MLDVRPSSGKRQEASFTGQALDEDNEQQYSGFNTSTATSNNRKTQGTQTSECGGSDTVAPASHIMKCSHH
eukprot:8594623-Karenia_brevis.AAC.1